MTSTELLTAVEKQISLRRHGRGRAFMIRQVVKDAIDMIEQSKPKQIPPSPRMVIKAVAEIADVDPHEIIGRRKPDAVVTARMLCMYLLRREYPLFVSYRDIGRIIGRRDHTSVIYGVRRVGELLDINDPKMMYLYNRYMELYKPKPSA